MEQELKRLVQSNLDRLQALSNQGININASYLALLKTETLIEFLIPEENKEEFAYRLELKKKEFIDQIMSELRKAQLTEGISQTNKLLRG